METQNPGAEDGAQLAAKLRGLERMHLAGLLSDAAYQAKLQELRGKAGLLSEPPPAPEVEVKAPAPLVVGGELPDALASPPAAPQPSRAPSAGRALGNRGVLVAAIVTAAALFIAGTFAVLATRSRNGPTSSPAAGSRTTATPDPDAALTALRTATPSLPNVVMDASDADKLVRAFWPARERALSTHDTRSVRRLETGAAAEWDAVGCSFGCAPPLPRNMRDLHVYVPSQAAYPAAFMAQVLTTEYRSSARMVELMVFSRASSSQPWSLAFDTMYTGATQLELYPASIDGGAFDADPVAVPGVDHTTLPARLAAYFQHWNDTGGAPAKPQFSDGTFSSAPGAALHEALLEKRADGIAESVTFAPDTVDGVWTFAVDDNPASFTGGRFILTCGTVQYTAVNTSTRSGGILVQDVGFQPFGGLLRPGAYASVTEQGLRQSCFSTDANELRAIEVVGGNGGTTSVTAVIAHAQT